MKKIVSILLCLLTINTVFSQMVEREELSSQNMWKSAIEHAYPHVDGEHGLYSSIIENNDELMTMKWVNAKGKFYFVQPYKIEKGKSVEMDKIKQEQKDCYHQVISNGVLTSYFIKITQDNFVISYEERNVSDLSLIREVVLRTIKFDPIEKYHAADADGYGFRLRTASSPNKRYFVIMIDNVSTFGFSNYRFSTGKVLLRMDALKHSDEDLKYSEDIVNEKNLYAISDTKVLIDNQGTVALVDQMISIDEDLENRIERYSKKDKKGLSELFNVVLKSFYYKLSYFPLNGSSSVTTQSFAKFLPNYFDIKFTRDHKVLLYGFASLSFSGYTNKFFTTIYNPDFELFTAPKFAQINGIDSDIASVDIDRIGHVATDEMELKPLDVVELNDGSFVAFANFHFNVRVSINDFRDEVDMFVNILHFVLNKDGSLRSQGVDFCCFPKSSFGWHSHAATKPYVRTDGDRAILFMPVMSTAVDQGSSSSIRYDPNLVVKVFSIDSKNTVKTQIMDENIKWMFSTEYLYGAPYYDELAGNWWLYLRGHKKCRLERWKIN